jgi:putative copper resistance protein D
MRNLYLLNVTLHVLAALLWLGGMFFFALVGAPVLRRLEPAALRARIFAEPGQAFPAGAERAPHPF